MRILYVMRGIVVQLLTQWQRIITNKTMMVIVVKKLLLVINTRYRVVISY